MGNRISILLFGIFLAVAAGAADWQNAVTDMIQTRIDHELFSSGVVGVISASSVDPQFLVFGEANPDNLFEIASITKSFTGIAFAEMCGQGLLSPTDPVSKYIPELIGTFAGSATLEQLATHTSGLPSVTKDLPNTANPYVNYDWSQLLAALQTLPFPDPGQTPYPAAYSNLGFALLGQVLSRVDHLSYSTLISKRITGPLLMSSTNIEVSVQDLPRFIDGHGVDLAVVPHWDWADGYSPAGALRSSARDMMVYVQANLQPDLSSDLGKAMVLSQSKSWGWDDIFFHAAGAFHFKNGGSSGFRSALIIDPMNKIGGIVLGNMAYQVDTVAFAILNPLVQDLSDFSVSDQILSSYVGTYSDALQINQIIISRPENFLYADFQKVSYLPSEGSVRLIAKTAQEFYLIDSGSALISLAGEIIFQTDLSGQVSGLIFQYVDPHSKQTVQVQFQKNSP